MTGWEEVQLLRLVDQAWSLRGTGYLMDACEAVGEWAARRQVARLEHSEQTVGDLKRLLRETHPARSRRAAR